MHSAYVNRVGVTVTAIAQHVIAAAASKTTAPLASNRCLSRQQTKSSLEPPRVRANLHQRSTEALLYRPCVTISPAWVLATLLSQESHSKGAYVQEDHLIVAAIEPSNMVSTIDLNRLWRCLQVDPTTAPSSPASSSGTKPGTRPIGSSKSSCSSICNHVLVSFHPGSYTDLKCREAGRSVAHGSCCKPLRNSLRPVLPCHGLSIVQRGIKLRRRRWNWRIELW